MASSNAPPIERVLGGKQVFSAQRMASDAIAAAVFGLLGVGMFALSLTAGSERQRSTVIWVLGLPALLLLGGIALVLVRRFFDRQPVLKLSNAGLKGRGLDRPLHWGEIEDVELDARAGGTRLLLHVANRGGVKSPQVVPLKRLKGAQRQAAFEAVLERVNAARGAAGLGETRTARELREAVAFDARLLALTPSVWAATGVVAVNVAVWLVQVALGVPPTQPTPEVLWRWGGNSAASVILEGEVWRLLTATFLHGGVMHLVLNMAGLWQAGRQLARQIGNGQFLLVYLASALCGSAASLHFAAQGSISVGASGAVFGVLGALVASSWKHRADLPTLMNKKLWSGPGLFTVYALVQGFGSSRVDNAAHLGGLVCGVALGLLLVVRFDGERPHDRPAQALLGALLAAVAVVVGLTTTPVPRTWHLQLMQASEVLRQAAPEFIRLGRRLEQFKGRDATDPAMRAFLQNEFLPGCGAIQRDMRSVQVPRWEPAARAAAMMGRMCALTSEVARTDLDAVTPEQRAAAQARFAQLQAQMQLLRQEMTAFAAAGRNGR